MEGLSHKYIARARQCLPDNERQIRVAEEAQRHLVPPHSRIQAAAQDACCLAENSGHQHSENELHHKAAGIHADHVASQEDQLQLIGHGDDAEQVSRHCEKQRERLVAPSGGCQRNSHACSGNVDDVSAPEHARHIMQRVLCALQCFSYASTCSQQK